jgi:hypothetical protein
VTGPRWLGSRHHGFVNGSHRKDFNRRHPPGHLSRSGEERRLGSLQTGMTIDEAFQCRLHWGFANPAMAQTVLVLVGNIA